MRYFISYAFLVQRADGWRFGSTIVDLPMPLEDMKDWRALSLIEEDMITKRAQIHALRIINWIRLNERNQ